MAESSNSREVYLPAVLTVIQPHIYLYCELHGRQRGVGISWLYCGVLSFSYTDCILHSREALTCWFCANCLTESGRHQMERKGKSVTLLVGKYIFSHRYIGQTCCTVKIAWYLWNKIDFIVILFFFLFCTVPIYFRQMIRCFHSYCIME